MNIAKQGRLTSRYTLSAPPSSAPAVARGSTRGGGRVRYRGRSTDKNRKSQCECR